MFSHSFLKDDGWSVGRFLWHSYCICSLRGHAITAITQFPSVGSFFTVSAIIVSSPSSAYLLESLFSFNKCYLHADLQLFFPHIDVRWMQEATADRVQSTNAGAGNSSQLADTLTLRQQREVESCCWQPRVIHLHLWAFIATKTWN